MGRRFVGSEVRIDKDEARNGKSGKLVAQRVEVVSFEGRIE